MRPPAIRLLRPLAGGAGEASVDLVEVGGRRLVLKRQSERHANAERRFHRALADAGLPHLEVVDHPSLGPDQILLAYVEGSTTIGRSQSLAAFAAWGAAIAGMHAITSSRCQELDERGTPIEARWPDVLGRIIDAGLSRHRNRVDGFPPRLVDRIAERLQALTAFRPANFALCRGDLHLNNALLRGDEVVLFDKVSTSWMAPPGFDLAVVYSEAFPGARYAESASRAGDDARLAAFTAGYGALPADQAGWIDAFVVLRALGRYPNPFVPDLLTTVEAALERME